MSIFVTAEELNQFRACLAESPAAVAVLDTIADCEGDLEDASIILAIQAGQEPDISDRWIDGLAKRWRHVLCRADVRTALQNGLTPDVLAIVTENTALPVKLAIPVVIYVLKTNVDEFCQLFDSKLQ
jgi:hypothetical protein